MCNRKGNSLSGSDGSSIIAGGEFPFLVSGSNQQRFCIGTNNCKPTMSSFVKSIRYPAVFAISRLVMFPQRSLMDPLMNCPGYQIILN